MLAIQNAVTKAPRLMGLAKTQTRSVVSSPPRNRVSFPEKVALGVIMYAGLTAIPLYISTNIKNYRNKA